MTGDIEVGTEQQLVASGVPLARTVLKAAHHDSSTSTTTAFLEAVDPEVVVISVGEDNDFGHPCAEALERLGPAMSLSRAEPRGPVGGSLPLYRTDEYGSVELITDGAWLWVEVQNEQ